MTLAEASVVNKKPRPATGQRRKAGWGKLGQLMQFVSRSVVTGFVNALAILIFMAQLPELTNVSWHVYAMTAAGLDIRTVGDMGQLPDSLPAFLIPNVPFNLETLLVILTYSLTLMVVGLLESLMTATIVDDLTDTKSNKNREYVGQGVAGVACRPWWRAWCC
jgi:SulP family sulfate permease